MTPPVRPDITCERAHAELAVPDVRAAVDFYVTRLGFTTGFLWGEPPTIAGVNLGEVSLMLRQGTPHPDGCSVYFVVGDADAVYDFHRAGGLEVAEPIADRDYGLRDYAVLDLYGHRLSFGHRIHETSPPLEIERVDVPVRLEKRLAAALHDLAAHKRMSLASCLEETLLHTFEPYGGGVASPHTAADLAYIATLKRRHGIDYDVHASYRFVEKA